MLDVQKTTIKLLTGEIKHRDQLGTKEDIEAIYRCMCCFTDNALRLRKQLHQMIKG